VIRVGGPSDPNATKIAVIGSSSDLRGRVFRVIDDMGAVVLTGHLKRAPRTARAPQTGPLPWRYAETADLSALTTPGNYRVRVGRMTSLPWQIYDGAAADLRDALLAFYPIANDGNEFSPVHGVSHLHDARLVTNDAMDIRNGQDFDLTGGWMDAGDPDKWVFTIGFATWALEAGARLEPSVTGLQSTADVGLRWLLKMHPPGSTLFVGQVGNASWERDNFGFRDPSTDDSNAEQEVNHRRAYETKRSDVAGKAAAALALASTLTTAEDEAQELAAAKEWYALGKTNATAASDPSCNDSEDTCTYDDSTWTDDMALAAAELYNATHTQSYLDDAYSYLADAGAYVGAGPDGYTTDPYAAAELCGALGGAAIGTTEQIGTACGDLSEDAGIAQSRMQNVFLRPSENDIATSCRNAAEGVIAAAATRNGNTEAETVAANARDYILGRNPWGLSFVVGFSAPSTQHPYHWLQEPSARDPIEEPNGWLVPGPTSLANFRSFGGNYTAAHGRFDTRFLGYADNHGLFHYNEGDVACQANGVLLAVLLDLAG